jgi:hypothetical protein
MLRVHIHNGLLENRCPGNLRATLDIAYKKQEAWSDYAVELVTRGVGDTLPAVIEGYPRWAGSLWDLVARALTVVLYRKEEVEAAGKPDLRCAYSKSLCAVIEKSTDSERGIQLGYVQINLAGTQRCEYEAVFYEDILGERRGHFTFGKKSLLEAELLLRAILWTYNGQDALGLRPALVVPATIQVDKVHVFDANSLPEPARTGFKRFRGANFPTTKGPEPMAKASEYEAFLHRG